MSTVAVIGAGIGGLSAALALAADGHQVTVLERTKQLEALGVGLLLTPNAVQVLDRLGVDLSGEGQTLSRLEVWGRSGRLISTINLAYLAQANGPSYGIARPRLHALLSAALPPSVELVLGAPVASAQQSSDQTVTLTWPGVDRAFDTVVVADGLRSLLGGPGQLRYSGNTCWRGIVPLNVGSVAVESWGEGNRVGVVPIGGGQVYYYLVRVSPAGAEPPSSIAQLRALFAGHGGTAGRLVDSLEEMPPVHSNLFELERPFWGQARILLLGDAAHAMTPNQGQGAAMAIEDAFSLAAALRPGVDGALERYRANRHRRVRRVQLTSRRIGMVANLRGPGVAWARETVMRLAPSTAATMAMQRLIQSGPLTALAAPPLPSTRLPPTH
ncbi:MAG: FAD-dependent oxidoreductase [Proteobacteria bacterium]|nr:FAD-dependent oxidoreductase [Cystobacterineae bacterium]MCL2258836.1 FAD-dependent oxidoreductase [Cystobacterineae bacterium]MCL2314782.1 FAD-dependent oxidoreductase [Pseudomonadota bacterium]